MTLNDLIDHANRYFPDSLVERYWDFVNSKPKTPRAGGDTLALFIVREIADTYDKNDLDCVQLATASRAIESAINELSCVANGLMKLAEKSAKA
jgi:hypothetical protein